MNNIAELANTPSVYLKTGSHRARQKVKALGIELRWYYDARLIQGGRFLLVSEVEYRTIKAAKISGITRARDQKSESYGKCWAA